MFRRFILLRILLTLILVGVLFAGGAALFRVGWAQGYQVGIQTTNPGNSQVLPHTPFYGFYPPYYGPGFGFPFFFFPFGPLLGIGFVVLLFFLIGGLFRPWGWRRWGGYHGRGGWENRQDRPDQPIENSEESGNYAPDE